MKPIFHLSRGERPLLISVPHAGTFIPDDVALQLNELGRSGVDTDWHVDRLYDFAAGAGATMLVATHARTVVDLNRGPGGEKLYPGQAETGICPAESFAGAPLYPGSPPPAEEIARRVRIYWQPYHDALADELARLHALHGRVILLDAHSIRGTLPRLFAGLLPDLNFGTNGGASAEPALVARAMAATAPHGFSQVLDGRFRGGYITRHYGNPGAGIHALQLELAQRTYMEETEPGDYDPLRAGRLVGALREMIERQDVLC